MVILDGHEITGVEWLGAHSIRVHFVTAYPDRWLQLYYGRQAVGRGRGSDGSIVGSVSPEFTYPDHLFLVASDDLSSDETAGLLLPHRPFNAAELTIDIAGWPDDVRWVEAFSGTIPGGPVDFTTPIARQRFNGDGRYRLVSKPLPGTGDWNFEIRGVDACGNVGDVISTTRFLWAHPPDLPADPITGRRFSCTSAAGTITVQIPA